MGRPLIAERRCLVLGASGFLGRWVCEELAAQGAHVVAQVRSHGRLPARLTDLIAECRDADLAPAGATMSLVREVEPDVVFNLAGYGVAKTERDEASYQRLNVALVAELAAAVSEIDTDWPGVRIVHVGSALEYGADSASLDESAPCRPSTIYGRTKLEATLLLDRARHGGLAAVTARAFTVFGLGERPGRLLPTMLAARAGSARIPLSEGRQARDWVYVEDVARALRELAELEAAAVLDGAHPYDAAAINLACGTLTPVREFVAALARELGIDADRLGFGDVPGLAEEMFHPPVPTNRLRSALGWTPPADPSDGIARLGAALRQDYES